MMCTGTTLLLYLLQHTPTQCQPHYRHSASSLPIPSQTEKGRRTVSMSLHIRVVGFNLNSETIKDETLLVFSQSLESNARIIRYNCLSVSFQIQRSYTILKFDVVSSDILTVQNP